MTNCVGILAYGSLIDDPGCEIESKIVRRVFCHTPFPVEYARKSGKRSNAPTLVPFDKGACVSGRVMVVNLNLQEAKNCLYRREINKVCCKSKIYSHPSNEKKKAVVIETLHDFKGIDFVIYASLHPNIKGLTAEKLACLAICSARKETGERDGISYLMNAKNAGIRTPLSDAYEAEILRRTATASLGEAREKCSLDRRCTDRF